MILVFGSINIDLVSRVVSIPRPGETVLSPRYDMLFGGKGANQAIAAARVSLPGRVTIAACVGDDAFGRAARQNLVENGVVDDMVVISTERTGCAFITVDEHGENAITVASGANTALTASSVHAVTTNASTVAVFQMEVPFAEALRVANRVRASGGSRRVEFRAGAGSVRCIGSLRAYRHDRRVRSQRTRGVRSGCYPWIRHRRFRGSWRSSIKGRRLHLCRHGGGTRCVCVSSGRDSRNSSGGSYQACRHDRRWRHLRGDSGRRSGREASIQDCSRASLPWSVPRLPRSWCARRHADPRTA